jgi:3-hydroxybutyrate dehydrogenase
MPHPDGAQPPPDRACLSGWDGRQALVTGAASGIGLALSRKLGALGARVVLVDLDTPALQAAVEAVPGSQAAAADLSNPEAVRDLDALAAETDVLVNNAGLGALVSIDELGDQKWQELLTVMLTAPFMLTRAALPGMARRSFGRIVNIASVYGFIAATRRVAYVSAKHGLLGLTKSAAVEAAAAAPGANITVNAVSPSYVRSGALERTLREQAAARGVSEAEIAGELMSRNLVKRLIEPDEIAEAVLFLCREDMWAITGQTLTMDAGWLAT